LSYPVFYSISGINHADFRLYRIATIIHAGEFNLLLSAQQVISAFESLETVFTFPLNSRQKPSHCSAEIMGAG